MGSSSGPECSSRSGQSTAFPSEIDSAIDRSLLSSPFSLMGHLLCELDEGAADRHVHGRHGWFLEHHPDLGIGQAHLDARDDELAILLAKARQRRFVALARFNPDRLV